MRHMATAAFSFDRFLSASLLSRVREVEEGLPVSALRAVADGKVVTLSDLVGVVAARRTLDRRLANDGRLTLEESDRLARFAEILNLTTQVIGDRARAMEWLRSPKQRLDGERPLDLMRTYSGGEAVVNLLNQARYGMLA
jgi:putative toxin-antitoxin system antitoxin component (TIGR02293 family)